MHLISNTLPQAIYHFISPLVGHFCGQAIIQLDQVINLTQKKVVENAQRIASIALLILGLAAICYLAIKGISEIVRMIKKDQTPVVPTLATEFSSVKQDLIIERRMLGEDLKSGTSAKIFLTIEHDNQHLTETFIIPEIDQQLSHQQINEQFIGQIDGLFDKLRTNIEFNDLCKTNFKILILLKSQHVSRLPQHQGAPLFTEIYGEQTVHKGKILGGSLPTSNYNFRISDEFQQHLCDLMNLPFTPQIDAQGEFI